MFYINTERLWLIPLSLDQLYILKTNRNTLERELGLSKSNFEINSQYDFIELLKESIENFSIPNIINKPDAFLFYTHWIMVLNEQNLTIGGMGMGGLPDAHGNVTIGYFIDAKFESQGYASEALSGFINWLKTIPEVKTVSAETLEDGYASQKVLIKNGFEYAGKMEEGLKWILIIK